MHVFSYIETPPEISKKNNTLQPWARKKKKTKKKEADIFIAALWVNSGSLYFGLF